MSKMKSEMEQQRLELQKTHSTEMEQVLGKVSYLFYTSLVGTVYEHKLFRLLCASMSTSQYSQFFHPCVRSNVLSFFVS